MVLITECNELGRVIDPTNPAERDQLRKDCLKQATRSNGVIDCELSR